MSLEAFMVKAFVGGHREVSRQFRVVGKPGAGRFVWGCVRCLLTLCYGGKGLSRCINVGEIYFARNVIRAFVKS